MVYHRYIIFLFSLTSSVSLKHKHRLILRWQVSFLLTLHHFSFYTGGNILSVLYRTSNLLFCGQSKLTSFFCTPLYARLKSLHVPSLARHCVVVHCTTYVLPFSVKRICYWRGMELWTVACCLEKWPHRRLDVRGITLTLLANVHTWLRIQNIIVPNIFPLEVESVSVCL